ERGKVLAVGGEIYGIRQGGRGPGGRTGGGQGSRDGALAAAGQDGPVAVVRGGEAVEAVDGAALFLAGQLGLADDLAQPPVAFRVAGQDKKVAAGRVGYAALPAEQAEAELGAEDGAQLDTGGGLLAGGGLGELPHAGHAVVVGEGERRR